MSIFWEIHQDLPREGPGDNAFTRKAFEMITGLPPQPRILDIGCGPGMQTIELALISNGRITAVDNHRPFLDVLSQRTQAAGLSGRIETLNQSMFSLDFPKNGFDLIWSEGAIYIMGFRKGLCEWREFLKPHGYIAVSECSWLKRNPPEDLKGFWDTAYPGMVSIEENSRIIQDCGYSEMGHFVLPESAWWQDYYDPLIQRVKMLREKYAGDPEAQGELDNELEEIEIYRKYHEYYGYVFYVMQRTPVIDTVTCPQ